MVAAGSLLQEINMAFRERLLNALQRTPEAELRAHNLAQSSLGAYWAHSLPLTQLCTRLADQHAKDNKVPLVLDLVYKYGVIPMAWETTSPLASLFRGQGSGPCAPSSWFFSQ